MNLRLAALAIFVPNSLKDEKLRELFQLTAKAFRTPMPDIEQLPFAEKLHAFAIFSRDQAQRIEREDARDSVKQRLFEGAYQLGDKLREQLGITTCADSMTAAGLLYRSLGIDFGAKASGEVTIKQCYFSKFYSSQDCRLLSSLDEGLIAGLSGGDRLSFKTRITEGHGCCSAKIEFKNEGYETSNRSGHRCRWCNGG